VIDEVIRATDARSDSYSSSSQSFQQLSVRLRLADDPPTIRNATARNYSPTVCSRAGHLTTAVFVHADCRQEEGSEADMPRLT